MSHSPSGTRMLRHHMDGVVFLVVTLMLHLAKGQQMPCPEDAVRFALTQCDEANGLWRVAVPQNGSSHCAPRPGNPPVRIHGCDTLCPAGHSYNLATLNCTQCRAGTYSAGNSQTFDDWQELPLGFTTQSAPLLQNGWVSRIPATDGSPVKNSCSSQVWLPRGDYVVLEEMENCISRLALDVTIVQEHGYVEFEYQFPESSLMFVFSVVSADCQTKAAGSKTDASQPFRAFPEQTMRSTWASTKIDLQRGKQSLVWMGISMASSLGSTFKQVRIRKVRVFGVSYSKACTVCPEGTFSSSGATRCEDCPLNHVAGKAAGACTACPDNQYALPGFLRCFERKPCTEEDYTRQMGPCKEDSTVEVAYDWILPKVCASAPGAAVLPSPSKSVTCPKCSLGTYRFNSTACSACEPGQFVNGQGKCQFCDGGMIPAYKYELVSWDYLPYNMDAFCWNSSAMGCAENGGWQLTGDSIHSGFGHEDDVLLVMQLSTAGFRKTIQQGLYGQLTFEFDMVCKSPQCQLDFMLEETETYTTSKIKTWTGPQSRQRFQYLITQNMSVAFTWMFVKTSMQSNQAITKPRLFGHDVFRIFSINLTNTVEGGADTCEPCVGADASCLRCGPSEIWNSDLKKCLPCPANSIVSELDGTCVACGPNLVASGKSCVSNCKVSLRHGKKHYDLTSLRGLHHASTQHFFHVGGEEYYHLYNISFCESPLAVCTNTLRKGSTTSKSVVSGFVCRTTHLVSAGDTPNTTTAMQSFVSGRELMEINDEHISKTNHGESLFKEVQPEFSERQAPDFYYRYRSLTATSSCPSGRSTVITMRCSKNTTGMHDIRVPSGCSEGTCDGCVYHLMWLTPSACPVCGPDDYTVVRGECSGSKQKIYYHSKPYCYETNSSSALVKLVVCHSVPFSVQVLLISLAISGAALAILVFILFKNARKYKHRYMKLVQDASGVIHLQLPESCVDDHDLDHEGEEEDKDMPVTERKFNVEFRTPSETVYTKVKKAVTRKKDLQRSNLIGDVRESEENELLAD